MNPSRPAAATPDLAYVWAGLKAPLFRGIVGATLSCFDLADAGLGQHIDEDDALRNPVP
jgi:hypothetical protein